MSVHTWPREGRRAHLDPRVESRGNAEGKEPGHGSTCWKLAFIGSRAERGQEAHFPPPGAGGLGAGVGWVTRGRGLMATGFLSELMPWPRLEGGSGRVHVCEHTEPPAWHPLHGDARVSSIPTKLCSDSGWHRAWHRRAVSAVRPVERSAGKLTAAVHHPRTQSSAVRAWEGGCRVDGVNGGKTKGTSAILSTRKINLN